MHHCSKSSHAQADDVRSYYYSCVRSYDYSCVRAMLAGNVASDVRPRIGSAGDAEHVTRAPRVCLCAVQLVRPSSSDGCAMQLVRHSGSDGMRDGNARSCGCYVCAGSSCGLLARTAMQATLARTAIVSAQTAMYSLGVSSHTAASARAALARAVVYVCAGEKRCR